MQLLDTRTAAARMRAAMAFGAKTRSDVANLLGVSTSTVGRMSSPTDPDGASLDQLLLIAELCTVPRWFMEHGFAPPAAAIADDIRDQLAKQGRQLDELAATLEQLALSGAGAIGATSETTRPAGALSFPPEGETPELPPEAGDSNDQTDDEARTG